MALVTSFRMYNAVPPAARAWRALFERVFTQIGAEVTFLEHGFPKPIDTLWREPGLFGAFMCGWPFTRADRAMQAIVAPVPSPSRYGYQPRYCSDFLARTSSGWARLEDAFGHRFGWMALDSQSGFNAPRARLSQFVSPERPRLFSESKGPYMTPAKTLEALKAGEVDLIALDGYYLDLVRHHDPQCLEGVTHLASTPWTPIPLLVAAPDVDPNTVSRFRELLLVIDKREDYRPLLADVLVSRFIRADLETYGVLEEMSGLAAARNYPRIE